MGKSKPSLFYFSALLTAGLFAFTYFFLILYFSIEATPLRQVLNSHLSLRDFGLLALCFLFFEAGFIPWTHQESRFRNLWDFKFSFFLLHSLILMAVMTLAAWLFSLEILPLIKMASLAALSLLLLPSARYTVGSILRVVFLTLERPLPYSALGGGGVELYGLPFYFSGDAFIREGVRVLNQARRFGFAIGFFSISFDPVELIHRGKNPFVDRPVLHQLLFLLTEKNRIYEPWTYFPDQSHFASILLLTSPTDIQAVVARFSETLKSGEIYAADKKLAISFKIAAACGKPEPTPGLRNKDAQVVEQELAKLRAALGEQKEVIATRELKLL